MKMIPNLQRLSSRVVRILGQNPGPFTLQGTNTYLIGTGKERILLDTGEGKESYIQLLEDYILNEDIKISTIILSHWHLDHVGGLIQILNKNNMIISNLKIYKMIYQEKDDKIIKYLTDIKEGDIKVEGATLKVLQTPGHTQDHLSFFLEEEKALFSADCILGYGTAVFENLKTYLNTLESLLKIEPKIQRIYPGHGEIIEDGQSKIKEYISHRIERENQIIDILNGTNKNYPNSDPIYYEGKPVFFSFEITKFLYASYDKKVLPAAEKLIILHLNKLKEDNKVSEVKLDDSKTGWIWLN